MLITHGCQISYVFCSAILKASEILYIFTSNSSLFELRAILRFCYSSLILSFFQTIAAPVVVLSSLNPLEQSFRSATTFCASKIALFQSFISSFPGNLELEIDQIDSVFSAESIVKLAEICRAKRWPYNLIY